VSESESSGSDGEGGFGKAGASRSGRLADDDAARPTTLPAKDADNVTVVRVKLVCALPV
jgi:hypothetical protein